MCVIIFIPQGETISKEELKQAWNTNPHGAGYGIRREGKVIYHRGFMKFNPFYNEIKHKIGKTDIVLHFRISTSSAINRVQTHMYELGNKTRLKGITENPVLSMNGSIFQQFEYKGFNDTMSYIEDNPQAFQIISDTQSQELLDIVEEATSSKWAIITPQAVLISKGFQYHNGKYYSNLNHITPKYIKVSSSCYGSDIPTVKETLIPNLYNKVKKNKKLYQAVKQYIEEDPYNSSWLYWLDTISELKESINYTD